VTEYKTVEAIQCVLGDSGTVLITGTPDNPPNEIKYEEVVGLRVFAEPNTHGPSFYYVMSDKMKVWTFDHKVEGTATQ
jgi:hypothetical protein